MTALYDIPTSFGPADTQASACSLTLGIAVAAPGTGVNTGANHPALALRHAP